MYFVGGILSLEKARENNIQIAMSRVRNERSKGRKQDRERAESSDNRGKLHRDQKERAASSGNCCLSEGVASFYAYIGCGPHWI